MYNYNQQLHFVGIGGVGMAGIAEVLLNLGYRISGSDLKANSLSTQLERLGAAISYGHASANIPADTAVLVISSAVAATNPEVVEAEKRGIPVIPRAEMLAELMRMKYGIAVAGSHGKTTTTSILSKLLRDIGLDPTVIVGGRVLSEASGATLGMGQYLVAEADESDGSFCLLKPAIAIVTNVDREHLGHYGSFGELELAFQRFMSSVPFYGLIVACFDDPVLAKLCNGIKRRVVSFGLSPQCQVRATDIVVNGSRSDFTLWVSGVNHGRVSLPAPGVHLVSNSLAAIAVGLELGASVQEMIISLDTFPGVARRSEVLFDDGEIAVIDDYAHHPTELVATISAIRAGWIGSDSTDGARESNGGTVRRLRLVGVFQPHRYSRTQELFTDFLTAFSSADVLLVTDIYAAGEAEIHGVNGKLLAESIRSPEALYVSDLAAVSEYLKENVRSGDVVLTLGAGSITGLAHQFADELRDRGRG